MNKITLTIGIPAYNEEANIKYLIEDLLKQDLSGYALEKIIVNSDGSTDNTVKIVKSLRKKKVRIIDNKNREGLSKIQNQIFKETDSDVLVMLNADIMIVDRKFIKKLIRPIIENKAELACSRMEELKTGSFIGEVLNTSMKFKTAVFEQYKNGNNLYTCHGTARTFSKKLYKKIEFKDSVGEDAYSYLFALFNGFRYWYVTSTKGYYRLPTNFKDHERQSIRFIQSKKRFVREFGDKFVFDAYKLPVVLLTATSLKFIARYPIHMIFYVALYYGLKLKSLSVPVINDKWEISASSKVLRAKSV